MGKILTDNGDIIQRTDPNVIGEDVEWSKRIRNKYKIVLNEKSIVKHTRAKFTGDEAFHKITGGNIPNPDYNFSKKK